MRNVPWWGVVSSATAPVLLVGGWTVASRLQPPSFNPMADTVSSLAAAGAADRWVMTLTFMVVAICNLLTAVALRPAGVPGRLLLTAGSAAGILVALNPDHFGGSVPHAVWASIGFGGLALWPAGAWQRGRSVPWGLRPAVCACAVAVLLALTAWFGTELVTGGGQAGLAERIVGAAQALWLLTVVLSTGPRAARSDNQKNLTERAVVPRPITCTSPVVRRPGGGGRDFAPGRSGPTSLAAGCGRPQPGHMGTAEVAGSQPEDAEVAPMSGFVVIVGDPGGGGSAFRVENPARLLRVWSVLRATREQLDGAALPPGGMPGLQRQLRSLRRQLELAVSPPLAAELQRILPSHAATPSAGALRIECAVLESWADSLVVQMLAAFVAAADRSQQGHDDRTAA